MSSFRQELYALFGIGTGVFVLRLAIRVKTVGLRGFQGDDYFSILALTFYVVNFTLDQIMSSYGNNNIASKILPFRGLTSEEISNFEFGSKLSFAVWYTYPSVLWSMKGAQLSFLSRHTFGLWQHKAAKWLGIPFVLSWIAILLTVTISCHPIWMNWQVVPPPASHCSLHRQNFYVTLVLDIITEISILVVFLPLLWNLRLPVRKKIAVGVLLCPGFLILGASIICIVFSLEMEKLGSGIQWGARATLMAIIAVNLPILQPLFRRSFWTSKAYVSTSTTASGESQKMTGVSGSSEGESLSRAGRPCDEEAGLGDRDMEFRSAIVPAARSSGDSDGSRHQATYESSSDAPSGDGPHIV